MPTINFSDEEFEHLNLLLSAEIDTKQYYVKMVRSVISQFKSVPKRRIKTSQPLELPATAIIDKPAKRRGRPPKNKTAEPSVAVAHSVSQPKGVQMVRLKMISSLEQHRLIPMLARRKERHRANYRRKGVSPWIYG